MQLQVVRKNQIVLLVAVNCWHEVHYHYWKKTKNIFLLIILLLFVHFIKFQFQDHYNVLHVGAMYSREDVVKLLLNKKGVDPFSTGGVSINFQIDIHCLLKTNQIILQRAWWSRFVLFNELQIHMPFIDLQEPAI